MVTKTKSEAATGDQQVLARVLKEAMKSGKYTIGTKEVISELKSSKMVIAASTISSKDADEGGLVKEAEKNKVPHRQDRQVLRPARQDDRKTVQGLGDRPARRGRGRL